MILPRTDICHTVRGSTFVCIGEIVRVNVLSLTFLFLLQNIFFSPGDGDCSGLDFKYGTRMATMVMYWYVGNTQVITKLPCALAITTELCDCKLGSPVFGYFNHIDRYSKTPEAGGHTNFRNAGVHVKPEFGNAIFFSYIDPEKKIMDSGFTEHSGCPVFEGEKKIVTQWIRLGVDTENPWDSFNTRTYYFLDVLMERETHVPSLISMFPFVFCLQLE